MKKLIELFNKKYGATYGIIDDSIDNEDVYKVYKMIKSLCSDDNEIMDMLNKIKLPNPRTASESIEKINAEHVSGEGLDDLIKYVDDKTEILPVANKYIIFEDAVPRFMENVAPYGTSGGGSSINGAYIFDNLQNTDMIVHSAKFNLIISFNDGTEDITKNINVNVNEQTGFTKYIDDYIVILQYNEDTNLIMVNVIKSVQTDDGYNQIPCTVTKATFICILYSGLLKSNVIEDIEYKKITNVPYNLYVLADRRAEALKNEEYYYLYDNSFVWDMNRINERLDENSGVTQNTSNTTVARRVIQVNQKESEGIGFGQLVPINNKRKVSIFAKADVDVIVKIYNPNTKELILTMNFDTNNSFEYTKGYIEKYQLNGINNIFIAFTIKDTPSSYEYKNKVHNLIVTDEYTFLKKAEILTKTNTKEYVPTGDYNPATKKYVDENTQLCWLEDYEATGDRLQYADVNVSSLTSRVFYAFNFKKHPGVTTVRLLKSYDDGTIKSIINLGSTLEYMYLMNISSSIMKFYLKYATGIVSECVCRFGNTSDECTFKRTPMVLYAKNTYEYTPTTDYNPTTKKYVDDKFIALDLMETVGTIPQSELQKCNNGTSRYVSSIDFDTLFSEPNNYMYYATYKDDTLIPIEYQSDYNRMVTKELDSVDGLGVHIGFDYGTHRMYPFNGGNDSIKAYTFTNDLIIKRCPLINANIIATKEYVNERVGNSVITVNNVNDSLTLTTDKNQYATLAVPVEIILPTVTSFTELHLFFNGSEGVTIGTTNVKWESQVTIENNKSYEIIFTYVNESIGWLGKTIVYS